MEERMNFDNMLWDCLLSHQGHKLVVVSYGNLDDPADVCLECEDCGVVVLDAELYTICARGDRQQPGLRVKTPLGDIIGGKTSDPEHPGVWLDLHRPDVDQDMPLALVEFCRNEGDVPEGDPNVITRVWGDAMQEDYTDRIVHQGIEDYFHAEE